jgi:hypothetical protein
VVEKPEVMGKLKAIELSMLIGNLALDSMNTQLLLNEAHEADIKRFESLAKNCRPHGQRVPATTRALAPAPGYFRIGFLSNDHFRNE